VEIRVGQKQHGAKRMEEKRKEKTKRRG